MCCFSGRVESVTNTNIFARSAENGRQFLVYAMTMSAKEDLAMILPLPVPKGSAEDAVRFISLKDYPDFFKDLNAGFPEPPGLRAEGLKDDAIPRSKSLKVVEVGHFEASFVPTVKDFDRLDARFRLPDATWEKLPAYREFGFAVFKLKKGEKDVHPMAFEFPRADPKKLFFPTVHLHDGLVHPRARFDHALFCQSRHDESLPLRNWEESPRVAIQFVKVDKTHGIVDMHRHCYRRVIRGDAKNEDVLL